MEKVSYARCPGCGCARFWYVDTAPEGEYPRCLFECTCCQARWAETQLKDIDCIEDAF